MPNRPYSAIFLRPVCPILISNLCWTASSSSDDTGSCTSSADTVELNWENTRKTGTNNGRQGRQSRDRLMTKDYVTSLTFKADYEADTVARAYGDNGLLLYAIALKSGIEDLDEFAGNALTDGGDDKKLDVCHIDEQNGVITLAQGLVSRTWGKPAAPANKASDLNTAAVWMFSANPDDVPAKLRTKVVEARNAIANGSISRVDVLFVHNCLESTNVERELITVAAGIRDILRSAGTIASEITVAHKEVGLRTIEEWFSARDTDILVEDWIDLPDVPFVEESGGGWRGIALSIPGSWIRDLYVAHQDKLFSANFRDYMGAPTRKENINFQIKQTAASEPENFWVYNNGITALTRQIDTRSTPRRIRGISVINGAQTSGAIGESSSEHASKIRVQLRIMEAKSEALISKAILYTNTQNEIKPFDRKSNDPLQNRLKDGLAKYDLQYSHRRSKARIPRGSITASSLGAALCAFHGDPQTAYRNSKDIFGRDDTYELVFRDVTPEHAYLLHSLSSAIDSLKLHLKSRISSGVATRSEEVQYNILRFSASKHFLLYVLGAVAEQILNRRISNLKTWKVKNANISPSAKRVFVAWQSALEVILPNLAALMGDVEEIYEIERNFSKSKETAVKLAVNLSALESIIAPKFKEIRAVTVT